MANLIRPPLRTIVRYSRYPWRSATGQGPYLARLSRLAGLTQHARGLVISQHALSQTTLKLHTQD